MTVRQNCDKALINNLYKRCKQRASKISVPFNINKKTFRAIILAPCAYCGKEPAHSAKAITFGKNSSMRSDILVNGIDRIDNKKGYTHKNVCSCCGRCNYLKGSLSREDLLWQISAIIPRLTRLILKR